MVIVVTMALDGAMYQLEIAQNAKGTSIPQLRRLLVRAAAAVVMKIQLLLLLQLQCHLPILQQTQLVNGIPGCCRQRITGTAVARAVMPQSFSHGTRASTSHLQVMARRTQLTTVVRFMVKRCG